MIGDIVKPILFMFVLVLAFSVPSEARPDSARVASIEFSGNEAFDDGTLQELMFTEESSLFSDHYFDAGDLADDLRAIVIFYRKEGFLQAEIFDQTLSFDEDRSSVDIGINIVEGPPTIVNEVVLSGTTHLSDSTLSEQLSIRAGDRYRESSVYRSKGTLTKLYRNAGFLDVEVMFDIVLSEDSRSCSVTFLINENQRYRIAGIQIDGLEQSHPSIVTRELEFSRGQFVDLRLLALSERNLYRTGLFDRVSIKPVPVDSSSGERAIAVSLREDDPGALDAAVGYGTVEKFRIVSTASYNNIFGRGYRSSISGKFSSLDQYVEATIADPWIFGIPWELALTGAVGRVDEPSYRLSYVKGAMSFSRSFLERSRFSATISHAIGSYDELRFGFIEEALPDSLSPEEIEQVKEILKDVEGDVNRTGLKLSLSHDRRNNLFDPSSGFVFRVSSEFIYGTSRATYLNVASRRSTNRIIRNEATFRYYHGIGPGTTLASSIEAGLINNLSPDQIVFLLDDLFYAGGPSALRGFDYKRVGPLAPNGNPLGGEVKLVLNLIEVRQRIVSIVGATAFLDIGAVWARPSDVSFADFRLSPGLGLRVDTPIGLGRFDYGFNPWPKPGEKSGQWWISIGHAF